MKKFLVVSFLVSVFLFAASIPTVAGAHHVQVRLHAVQHSGVAGIVDLTQRRDSGTHIVVNAFGLKSGDQYQYLRHKGEKIDK